MAQVAMAQVVKARAQVAEATVAKATAQAAKVAEGSSGMDVLAFDSTHAALAAQQFLAPLNPYVIPTPREITADCGMSLKFQPDAVEEAKRLMSDHPDIQPLCHWHHL